MLVRPPSPAGSSPFTPQIDGRPETRPVSPCRLTPTSHRKWEQPQRRRRRFHDRLLRELQVEFDGLLWQTDGSGCELPPPHAVGVGGVNHWPPGTTPARCARCAHVRDMPLLLPTGRFVGDEVCWGCCRRSIGTLTAICELEGHPGHLRSRNRGSWPHFCVSVGSKSTMTDHLGTKKVCPDTTSPFPIANKHPSGLWGAPQGPGGSNWEIRSFLRGYAP